MTTIITTSYILPHAAREYPARFDKLADETSLRQIKAMSQKEEKSNATSSYTKENNPRQAEPYNWKLGAERLTNPRQDDVAEHKDALRANSRGICNRQTVERHRLVTRDSCASRETLVENEPR